jgi:hypothetical protein
MPNNDTPIVLVVCNDYGELAFALYLLEGQSFAHNTTLMLPPRLYGKNPDVLPGRTFLYHSLDDVRNKVDSQIPGILGLFSGYLLPIHRLCDPEALDALMRSTQAKGWKSFTSDPFLGLLEEMEPGNLVTLKSPRMSIVWSIFAAIEKRRLARLLTDMRRLLKQTLHIYPCGRSQAETDGNFGKRMHFHNNAFFEQHAPSASETPIRNPDSPRWLFVLGDEDLTVNEAKYGSKFPLILTKKLHETLEAGKVPTVIAPLKIIEAVQKHSPVAHAMELLGHCDYAQFRSLLIDAEYVFYWNAVSFSCILRTLTGKPWFTFEDGHLIRGMNADYSRRIFDWFYRGGKPPYLEIGNTLSSEAMQDAGQQYLPSAQRIQQGLLDSPTPAALLSALATQHPPALKYNSSN